MLPLARPDELSLSYNGGKDCLVLLILILACIPAWSPYSAASEPTKPPCTAPQTLQSVYVVSAHPFEEVEEFVASSAAEYHLDLARYELSMRAALEAYLAEKPGVKAIFVGTRRTDPHGEFLTHFDPTDKGWPQFMRIHPVIDWHYVEIWAVSIVFMSPSTLHHIP
jgi:FAD synthetase